MADEHFLTAGDFSSGLGATPFLSSAGPYALPPPPGLDLSAFGMLPPWAASEPLQLPLPSDPAAASSAHFDSALSSLVSSPTAHASGGDDVAIGDLIGRLGSIICNTAASANNSCYSTPLSSPPRGTSPAGAAFRWGSYSYHPGAAPPLETGGGGSLSRVASSKSLGVAQALENAETEARASPEAAGAGNNITEAPAGKAGTSGSGAARKRKASGGNKQGKTAAAATNGNPKKSKVAGGAGDDDVATPTAEEQKPEPVKDYIHVRARRGQATDSHSLAERVRREKISERMKLLQSLVPGCNKITGKALMLDEIINYVQSLQRQVEFLSMKLSKMNPQLDVDAQYQQLPSDKDMMMMHHETGTAPAPMPGYQYHTHEDAAAAQAFSYATRSPAAPRTRRWSRAPVAPSTSIPPAVAGKRQRRRRRTSRASCTAATRTDTGSTKEDRRRQQ